MQILKNWKGSLEVAFVSTSALEFTGHVAHKETTNKEDKYAPWELEERPWSSRSRWDDRLTASLPSQLLLLASSSPWPPGLLPLLLLHQTSCRGSIEDFEQKRSRKTPRKPHTKSQRATKQMWCCGNIVQLLPPHRARAYKANARTSLRQPV